MVCHFVHINKCSCILSRTRNRTNFLTFFALPNFKGGGAPKSCTCVNTPTQHPNLETHQVPKFRQATPPNSEVLSAPLLHFKAIFDPPLKKIVKEAPIPGGGALVRLGHSLARVKILGRSTP